MKRSEINSLLRSASRLLSGARLGSPAKPALGYHRFRIGRLASLWACSRELGGRAGVLRKADVRPKGMTTPAHAHAKKKEDIICRWGKLAVQVWANKPPLGENKAVWHPD